MSTTKAQTGTGISATIEGGVVQGIVGAGKVVVENLNFYGPALSTAPERPADQGEIPPCPYPGLLYFGPEDSALFFGRDAAIAQLETAVARQTLTALVGASGSGKSSLVLAGLAPRLHGRGSWRFSHFRVGTEPDQNPFLALSRALLPLLGAGDPAETLKKAQALATELESGGVSLANTIGGCRMANPGKRVLLIADQFEEVFTLVADEPRRRRFIDLLLAGFPEQPGGDPPNICLMLTLRADFYGMALRHRALADALQDRVVNLGPMTREELRDAIIRPAQAKGVGFEAGLVETLLDAVTSKPGSLPLLQFALREMWRRLETRTLSRSLYDAIGGVEGAIAQRAQSIYDERTAKGEDEAAVALFRRLFTRLVTLGEGREDTRRIVGREELGERAWQLAQRLAGEGNRLVVTTAPAPGHETAEVVHEALIRNWPALTEWVNRDRTFQSWLRQLRPRVEEWRKHPDDDGTLLRGGPLAVAEDWLERRRDDLSEEERAYVEAGVALRDAERRRKEQELAREHAALEERERLLKATARTQRRASVAIVGIGILMLAMLANVLWQQEDTARREMLVYANLADQAMKNNDFDGAMRLALQAYPAPGAIPWPWASLSSELENKLAGAAMASRLYRELTGHKNSVSAVAFSPDGHRVVTASRDRTTRLWDAETGAPLAVLTGRGGWVFGAAFSPDGKLVVTASFDKIARIWDVASRAEIAVLEGHRGWVNSAAFSPDSKRVVTAGGDYTARIWDAASGREIRALEGHKNQVKRAVFSPDGGRVVTASDDDTARVWDADSGATLAILEGHSQSVLGVAFSPDGKRVLTASFDKTARIWDAAGGPSMAVLTGHGGAVNDAAFSPDGERIVTASNDNTAMVWQTGTGARITTLQGHGSRVYGAAFSPDGKRIVTASNDGTARMWDAGTGLEIAVLKGHMGSVNHAAFSPDGRRIVTAGDDNTPRLWDAGGEIAVLSDPRRVNSAALSRDGKRVLTASADGTARVRDAATGTEIVALKGHRGEVYRAVFSPDDKRIVTASEDHTARLWDADSGRPIGALQGHTGSVNDAAFSPDGKHIVTAADDRTARLWDADTLAPIATLEGHSWSVHRAAFSPDGRRVVTAYDDGTVGIWDVDSRKEVTRLRGHADKVYSAAFSPDGKRIVTGSWDGTARLWDSGTGQEIKVLYGHPRQVFSAGFSPDGRRVVTTSQDRTVRLWDADSGTEIAVLRGHTADVGDAAFSADGERLVTASADRTARLWDVSWVTVLTGRRLFDRVCAEKLVGAAQVFTASELNNPVLRGVTPTNPCLRRGPLSLDYWTRLPAQWWAAIRGP